MKRSCHQLVLFLALLLSWGQVLAAPFLPCHHQVAGMALVHEAASGHPAALNVTAQDAQHQHQHSQTQPAAMQAVAESHAHGEHVTSTAYATDDCDPCCRLQCVSILVLALPALPFSAAETAPAVLGKTAAPFLPMQPPAAHFRPPQAA